MSKLLNNFLHHVMDFITQHLHEKKMKQCYSTKNYLHINLNLFFHSTLFHVYTTCTVEILCRNCFHFFFTLHIIE